MYLEHLNVPMMDAMEKQSQENLESVKMNGKMSDYDWKSNVVKWMKIKKMILDIKCRT